MSKNLFKKLKILLKVFFDRGVNRRKVSKNNKLCFFCSKIRSLDSPSDINFFEILFLKIRLFCHKRPSPIYFHRENVRLFIFQLFLKNYFQ